MDMKYRSNNHHPYPKSQTTNRRYENRFRLSSIFRLKEDESSWVREWETTFCISFASIFQNRSRWISEEEIMYRWIKMHKQLHQKAKSDTITLAKSARPYKYWRLPNSVWPKSSIPSHSNSSISSPVPWCNIYEAGRRRPIFCFSLSSFWTVIHCALHHKDPIPINAFFH